PSTSRPCFATPAWTCCWRARRPSARWRRCSASPTRPKPSPWPTTPSSGWPATSTPATSPVPGAWPKRWSAASSASTPAWSRPRSPRSAASSSRALAARGRGTGWRITGYWSMSASGGIDARARRAPPWSRRERRSYHEEGPLSRAVFLLDLAFLVDHVLPDDGIVLLDLHLVRRVLLVLVGRVEVTGVG